MIKPKVNRPYIVDNVRIGSLIKTARNNCGMTQEQLAEAVDVTPAFIGHIERGSKSLSLTTLVGISQRLNVSIDYLLSGEEITPDDKVVNDVAQLLHGRPTKAKEAVLNIIRVALQYLE